jgi:hypothetical protein
MDLNICVYDTGHNESIINDSVLFFRIYTNIYTVSSSFFIIMPIPVTKGNDITIQFTKNFRNIY